MPCTVIPPVEKIAGPLGLPVLTGTTPQRKRDELFAQFKEGRIRVLAVSKVANFAGYLPEASVAIQISGTFGSRQEEAQRLGRILRPKRNGTVIEPSHTREYISQSLEYIYTRNANCVPVRSTA